MNKLKVLYDGACIICDREINHYKKKDKDDQLELVDISAADFKAHEFGLKDQDVNLNMHAIDHHGNVYIGVSTFIEIWKRIPQYKFLIPIFENKLLRPLFNKGYTIFAKHIRPRLPKRKCTTEACSIYQKN